MPAFLNPAEAEFWVGAGVLIFLAIAWWKGRGAIFGTLDAKAVKIRADLDEAARLRAEAETLLTQLKRERVDAERRAADMLRSAETEARRMQDEARTRLDEQIARRQALAERKIAQAEQQATAEVKAAAADLALRAAEAVMARRLTESRTDPLLEPAIERMRSAQLQ